MPVTITSRRQALASAGSRYAPVAALDGVELDASTAVVAKPCEVAAARALSDDQGGESPVMLSFFCAGTPSQKATDSLVRKIGLEPDELTRLKYRGDGWPGFFTATDTAGKTAALSYSESWGSHLGRDLQMRCKLCVDGTGEAADIAVGDFWDTDENGYPLFAEQDGESVAIARTQRGHQLLLQAAESGAVVLEELDLDLVVPVQPLQVKRRRTLAGRLLGRRLAGYQVPKYQDYEIWSQLLVGGLVIWKTAAGTFLRSFKSRVKAGSPDR
ncbi:hypothetical protein C5C17_02215 [Pseudoclavibacter sp. RFBA6]|nr:hypothetical protein C5C17_02215 [Pseudoclavibacter sp. RFBA6]